MRSGEMGAPVSDYWDHRRADPRGRQWHAPASSGDGDTAYRPRRGPVAGVTDYWQGIWPARPAPVAMPHRPAVPPALVACVVGVLLAGVASAVVRVGV